MIRGDPILHSAIADDDPGIGPITASALAATVEDPASFSGPREFAAFLGLVPRQNSSGITVPVY